MIETFRIQNFRSIVDLTVDFTYREKKAPNRYKDSEQHIFHEAEPSKKRLIPCLALFGANAAGKTNIIDAMSIFRFSTMFSYGEAKHNLIPNRLILTTKPILFELTFYYEKTRYIYGIAFTERGILHEKLMADNNPIYEISNGKITALGIATQTYTPEKIAEIFHVECDMKDGFCQSSALAVLGKKYLNLNRAVRDTHFAIFCDFLTIGFDPPNTFLEGVGELAEEKKVSKEAALDFVTDFIRKFDIGINSITHHEYELQESNVDGNLPEKKSQKKIRLLSRHTSSTGEEIVFNFLRDESSGTIHLAYLLTMILLAFERGAVLIIDELERSLHPLLVKEIIRFFKNKAYNKNGAQLLFTTHNTDILEDRILRVSEIGIVQKSLKRGTEITYLTKLKEEGEDIRNVTDFRKNYLDGFYRGVPYPTI